ncbi:MAG TPA: amidohydrolase family protein, partial [Pirellulales bacterium]|nr:amidohydrolase family protein [Pirellulales bacterium]
MKTATGTTIIRHGQLVDGTGTAPIRDGQLTITDGRITYAGPSHSAPPAPPHATTIDALGGTVLPGLIEAHFHPTYFNVA